MLRYRLPTVLQQLQSARSCPATQVRTMHASAHAYAIPALRCSATIRRSTTTAITAASSSSAATHSCPCCCGLQSSSSSSAAAASSSSTRSFSSKAKSHANGGGGGGGSTVASRQAKSASRTLSRLGFNPLGYRVAIFGRPNVGKSTLFNRLVGRSLAIVDSNPGVTRDRREADATLGELEFKLVDTAGLEEVQQFLTVAAKTGGSNKDRESLSDMQAQLGEYRLVNKEPMSRQLQESIVAQTALAIAECDVALFVIDGREGVTPLDRFFARWLRRQCSSTQRVVDPTTGAVSHITTKKPVVLLANKCDNAEHEHLYHGLTEGWELGFDEPVAISADHAAGLSGLHNKIYEAFVQCYPHKQAAFAEREKRINEEVSILPQLRQIRLAIVGKVNVGKSTLLNTLLGAERSLTGSQPGVTRDPVEVEWRDPEEEAREEALERAKILEEQQDTEANQQPAKPIESNNARIKREKKEAEETAAAAEQGLAPPASASASSASTSTVPALPAVPSYRFTLVDTAGLKGVTSVQHAKYSRVDGLAMGLTMRAIDKANVVALLVDITDARIDGVGREATMDGSTNKNEDAAAAAADKNKGRKHGRKGAGATPAGKTPYPSPSSSFESDMSSSIALSSMLFKPDRKYSEVERGFLLRTFVRNVFSAGDLAIASRVLAEGRGLLIILNKFDMVPAGPLRSQILEGVALELNSMLSGAGTGTGGGGVRVLGISGSSRYDASRGQQLKTTIRQEVIGVFERWSRRVATHRLNAWLQELLKFHPPPPSRLGGKAGGTYRKTSLKFIQQVSTGPPTFVIFANTAGVDLPEAYRAFLVKSLREEFGLSGTPLRLFVRARKNPYLDPQTKLDAKEKQNKAIEQTKEAVPTFADGEEAKSDAAAEDDDDEGAFDESQYDDKEVRFDYDAESVPSASEGSEEGPAHLRTEEAREERRREVQQLMAIRAARFAEETAATTPAAATTAKKIPLRNLDAPIPRVASATAASASQRGATLPRVNTSSIFASTRTVASKPGRSLGVNASARWSLDRPRLPGPKRSSGSGSGAGSQATWSAFPSKKDQKPFGTKRPKEKAGAAGNSILQMTINKANEHDERKKSAAKARKAATKSRRNEQNARR